MTQTQQALKPAIGYVVSQYPAFNHTFILREIRSLRDLGYAIQVVSIREPDRPIDKLSEVEADEARQTISVLGMGFGGVAAANLKTLFSRRSATWPGGCMP